MGPERGKKGLKTRRCSCHGSGVAAVYDNLDSMYMLMKNRGLPAARVAQKRSLPIALIVGASRPGFRPYPRGFEPHSRPLGRRIDEDCEISFPAAHPGAQPWLFPDPDGDLCPSYEVHSKTSRRVCSLPFKAVDLKRRRK